MAIRLIEVQEDQTGRTVLVNLKNSGSAETREKAVAALQTLDEAQRLVNIFEFGRPEGDKETLKDPQVLAWLKENQTWAQDTARKLGISSKLGVAILYETAVHTGKGRAREFSEYASKAVPTPLENRDNEKAWLSEYLNLREEALKRSSIARLKTFPKIRERIVKLRSLLDAGDWDLYTVKKPIKDIE